MSDTDTDPSIDPSDFVLRDQRRTNAVAISSMDAEPDKAARAMELGDATGDHPELIYANLENYEAQHKATLTSALLNSNKYLRQYVDADSMNAKLSNDDYGNLDTVSEAVQKTIGPNKFSDWLKSDSLWKEFWEGVGDQPLGSSAFRTQADWNYAKDHPIAGGIAASLATIGELVSRPASGVLNVLAQETGSNEPSALLEYLMMKGEGPGFSAGHFNAKLFEQIRQEMPGPAAKLSDMATAIRPWIESGHEPPAGLHPEIDKLKYEQNKLDVDNLDESLQAAQTSATRERSPETFANFIRQHSDARIGISGDAVARLYGDKVPTVDDNILGWSPGIVEELETAKATGGDVNVPLADWLAKVDPEVAKELHDDIRVRPGAITKTEKDWLAEAKEEAEKKQAEIKYNPAIQIDGKVYRGINHGDALERAALALKEKPDDLIERLGGSNKTFDEANGFVDEDGKFISRTEAYATLKPAIPLPEPLPQLRASSALEPLFSVGDRKLELKRAESIKSEWMEKQGLSFHDFDLLDENGIARGHLSLSEQKGGKQLYVEMIQGGGTAKMYDPNFFGPALMRSLLKQIKEEFPNAESITGHRVSGAREKAGTYEAPSAIPVVKFDQMDDPALDLRKIFEGGQSFSVMPGIDFYYSPLLKEHQLEADKAIREELARITPKQVTVSTPNKIEVADRPDIERKGQYTQFTDQNPWITVALDSGDHIGVARHEAIHHLRQQGFFTVSEWATLERAARERDWKEAYNIDARYDGLDQKSKLEESIADAYKYWKAGDGVPDNVHPIFEKLKEFFNNLRLRMKEIFGRDFTWDELFEKVDSGEIGSREGNAPGREGAFRELANDEREQPKAANDVDANSGDRIPTYDAAVRKQQIEQLVNKDTKRGDFDYWRKVSEDEELLGLNGKPNAFAAARAYSRDGKTTLVIGFEGVRTVFHDGVKIVRERYRDVLPPKGDDEPISPLDRGSIMTKDAHDRYMKLIANRHAEDLEAATRRAEAQQWKEQTQTWKDNKREVKNEVTQDMHLRPDVAVDLFLGAGEYLGGKMDSRPKLREGDLSAEQKQGIPKSYYAKDGIPADDVANLFGYPAADVMLDRLAQYNQVKLQANMSPKDFVARAIDMETDRQMQLRYGNLEQSILDEAKDQALSETQLNLLHEETMALGLKAGGQAPLAKADLAGWVRDQFNNTPLKSLETDKFLASAGKSGRAAEMALLKEDYAEAFREKQRQYIATSMAIEAKKLDKAKAQFDKIVKRYSKREVSGASPEYTDAVHDILMRLGETNGRRTVQDLQDSYKLNGYDGLRDFVASKESQLRDLHTPEWVQDPAFRKPTEDLTAQEFGEVHDALKAITHNSRDELKVNKAGEKADLEVVLNEMIDKMKSLGEPKVHAIDRSGRVADTVKSWWWSGINVESMLNRLDRDDPWGPFYQYITHHFTEAANYKEKLIKDFQKKLSAIGKIEDMDKQVENTLFKDPLTGEAFPMRRRNVLGILQQAGNKNNLVKLAKGYGLETSEVLDWLHSHTTKEDWDRAQSIGNVFGEVFDMANTMSHNISGVGIQRLPLEPLDTPHGTYPGWYNPIKYDSLRPGTSKKLMGPNAIEEDGFYRATTPQGYTKGRTGYIAPVELNLDVVPQRMKQMLHDIAMRPAILQMSKFFYDNRFERAMTAFYGKHQAKEMIPFLRDIANAPNFKSMTEQFGNEALEYFRQNTIATLIGFNPGTVMKHGATAWINSMTEVGALNYLHEFKNITAETVTGRATWIEAMEKSEELQRRMRNYAELIEGHGSEINLRGARSGFMSLRELVTNVGATPVSISDLLSAVPTWAAKYKTEIAAGTDEGMAVSLANRAVRNAHGSSIITNKPAIARTNALGAMFSSLYGFFSHMQQKQYALAWKARDMLAGQRSVPNTAPDLIRGLFSYVIAPAIIEELVTPTTNSEHESWGKKAATTLAMGVSSSFIGVRDFVRAAINVRDPQAGLIGTSMKTGTDLARDLSKDSAAFTKDKAGNLIKHTAALTGVLTGLTNEQEGKMAEYLYKYSHGIERPKGPWDFASGLRYGTTDKHPHSFDQWKKQTFGGR